jgi:hypothetical protein
LIFSQYPSSDIISKVAVSLRISYLSKNLGFEGSAYLSGVNCNCDQEDC